MVAIHPYAALGLEVLVAAAVVEVICHHTAFGLGWVLSANAATTTGDKLKFGLGSFAIAAVSIAVPVAIFHFFVWKKYVAQQ